MTKARFEQARHRDVVVTGRQQPPITINAGGGRSKQTGQNSHGNTRTTEVRKCYHCGGTNHLLRECPLKGRSASREAGGNSRNTQDRNVSRIRDRGVPSQGVHMVTAAENDKPLEAVGDKESQDSVNDTVDRVIITRDIVSDAIDQVVATLHGVEPQQGIPSVLLGLTPISEVCLEGVPVKALLDTGSPISITSLEFFLKACVQNWKTNESPEEWGRAVKQQLQQPTVALCSYGGGELNIVSQVKCRVSRDNFIVETVLQVQKGAPVDLLLGTDILSCLGFTFSRLEKDGKSTDLLEELGSDMSISADKGVPGSSTHSKLYANVSPVGHTESKSPSALVPGEDTKAVIVRLIQATRLPAHHYKLVHVSVDAPELFPESLCVFEPQLSNLHLNGVTMADRLVDVKRVVTLVIRNQGVEPVLLEGGHVMGYLQPAKLIQTNLDAATSLSSEMVASAEVAVSSRQEELRVAAIQSASQVKELFTSLKLEETDLTPDEKLQLENLVREFCGLFAFSSAELSHTSLVEHHINTGGHPPIR